MDLVLLMRLICIQDKLIVFIDISQITRVETDSALITKIISNRGSYHGFHVFFLVVLSEERNKTIIKRQIQVYRAFLGRLVLLS
jgi:hypothetical protein